MDYTQNLHLPQWEADDRIMMDDFNDAFQKLDAIAAASPIVKLKSVTLEQAQNQYDLDVSNIDFENYVKIELLLTCPAGFNQGINIAVNGLTSDYKRVGINGYSGSPSSQSSLATILYNGYGVILFYTPIAGNRVACVNILGQASSGISGDGYQTFAPCTWSQLHTFNFSGNLPADTKIILLGTRA